MENTAVRPPAPLPAPTPAPADPTPARVGPGGPCAEPPPRLPRPPRPQEAEGGEARCGPPRGPTASDRHIGLHRLPGPWSPGKAQATPRRQPRMYSRAQQAAGASIEAALPTFSGAAWSPRPRTLACHWGLGTAGQMAGGLEHQAKVQPRSSGAGRGRLPCGESRPVTWGRAVDLGGRSHVPIPHTDRHTHARTHAHTWWRVRKAASSVPKNSPGGAHTPHTQAVQKQMGDKDNA